KNFSASHSSCCYFFGIVQIYASVHPTLSQLGLIISHFVQKEVPEPGEICIFKENTSYLEHEKKKGLHSSGLRPGIQPGIIERHLRVQQFDYAFEYHFSIRLLSKAVRFFPGESGYDPGLQTGRLHSGLLQPNRRTASAWDTDYPDHFHESGRCH